MNSDFYLFIGIAGILIAAFIVLSMVGGNKKYKVTMANNEVLELKRKWNDSWNDSKEMKMYHKDDGKRVILSTHWIIKSEEIDGKGEK